METELAPIDSRYRIVIGLSIIVHTIWFLGGTAIYQPDAGSYVLSAMTLREGLEAFANSISTNRVPGYSLFAGLIFWPAGNMGMTVLMLVQHALLVLGSALVVSIGDEYDKSGRIGFVTGLLSCFSFQLFGYSHQPMSEVPYTVLLTAGTLLTVRYLKTDRAVLLFVAVAIFSIAALFRPTAKILPWVLIAITLIRGFWPGFGWPERSSSNTSRAVQRAALGVLIASLLMGTWATYNFQKSGNFALTGTFGLNMYSNTIEYGGFMDSESAAQQKIQKSFELGKAKRLDRGIPTDPNSTWRQHIPAMTHYMAATGADSWAADKLLLEAAVDAITAHPDAYIRHVALTIIRDMIYVDDTYRALPGLQANEPTPWWAAAALPAENWDAIKKNVQASIHPRGYIETDPVISHDAGLMTPAVGLMASLYHSFIMKWYIHGLVFAAGMLILVWRAGYQRDPVAWVLVAFFAFQIVMTSLVVPGSARYRMPGDLVFCVIYAIPLAALWLFIENAVRRR